MLGKNEPKIVSQMVVQNGDESHGAIGKNINLYKQIHFHEFLITIYKRKINLDEFLDHQNNFHILDGDHPTYQVTSYAVFPKFKLRL